MILDGRSRGAARSMWGDAHCSRGGDNRGATVSLGLYSSCIGVCVSVAWNDAAVAFDRSGTTATLAFSDSSSRSWYRFTLVIFLRYCPSSLPTTTMLPDLATTWYDFSSNVGVSLLFEENSVPGVDVMSDFRVSCLVRVHFSFSFLFTVAVAYVNIISRVLLDAR